MAARSWVESANEAGCDFPLENLPYGVFRGERGKHLCVAIGDRVLDLRACVDAGWLSGLPAAVADACSGSSLNALMGTDPAKWRLLRERLTGMLSADAQAGSRRVEDALRPLRDVEMLLPVEIGDYTDFYASIYHATRVGKLFRPENPLLPNYKYVPIGYHGRASSIVVSGTEVRRPWGQTRLAGTDEPVFGPARSLDYELEVGAYVGSGNAQGEAIAIGEAEEHVFGLCLVNDWSARDLQVWEYQPLGPFLAKSFATSVSPWVVTLEALAPYRVQRPERPREDPAPLAYLSGGEVRDGFDVRLEVWLQSAKMREASMEGVRVSRGNARDLYWSIAQMVTHHASNGCNLRTGDLLATGTVSGPEEGSEGCLLEMRHRPEPLRLPTGETRGFLEDGDEVILRGYAERDGLPRIGFGECRGKVLGARGA